MLGRRDFLVAHLLATVSSERILLKASFVTPLVETPELLVGRRRVAGIPTDTQGLFFAFDAGDLTPGRRYRLRLLVGGRDAIEPWPLATFPPPDATPRRVRLLVYTCAGGNDVFPLYVPLPLRQRLLRRALTFRPDAVVAIVTDTPGTGVGWPSVARGTLVTPPAGLVLETVVPMHEVNGFHLVDFERHRVSIHHFRWDRRRDPAEAIDTLEPFHVSRWAHR
jgi:hypothetical protein